MLSFGQRLKMLRCEAELSQSELADAIGASVQSVSRWECDSNMPDISLLLPLSAVLGVTADCLLGAGTNEKEDKEELYRLTEKMNENGNYFTYENNTHIEVYEKTREFLRKYPLNYDVRFDSAELLELYLWRGKNHFSIPNDEFDTLWAKGVKDLKMIINHDNDPTRQLKAMIVLIDYYRLKAMWDEAEEIAESLPDISGAKLMTRAKRYIAAEKNDYVTADKLQKEISYEDADTFLSSLWARARYISVFGQERKEEAIQAWKDMRDAGELCLRIFGNRGYDEYSRITFHIIDALEKMSNDYLTFPDMDAALCCVEYTASLYETLLERFDECGIVDAKRRKELLEEIKNSPIRCYNCVFDNDDNILTREERFKACKARLESLE